MVLALQNFLRVLHFGDKRNTTYKYINLWEDIRLNYFTCITNRVEFYKEPTQMISFFESLWDEQFYIDQKSAGC